MLGGERPSLLLEHDAGDVVGGSMFVLDTDHDQVIIGEAPGVGGIRIGGAQLARRHLRLTQRDGAWFVADIHGTSQAAFSVVTHLNGALLDEEPRAIRDGDRIYVQSGGGGVVLVFKDRGRLITGVSLLSTPGTADVVTFCPWHRYPLLSYAMQSGSDRVRTAIEPSTQWFVVSSATPEETTVAEGVQLIDDIHGIFLGDVVRLSLEEKASIDVAILLDVARLASSVPSGVHLRNRALLTFRGGIVWFGDPLGQESSALRQGLVHQLLATLGCKPLIIGPSATETLREQRRALNEKGEVPLDSESRDALLHLVDTAISDPARIPSELAGAATSLGGPPSRDSIRGLVANLFPNEHARHQRVMEEAQLLGFRGIVALADEENERLSRQ